MHEWFIKVLSYVDFFPFNITSSHLNLSCYIPVRGRLSTTHLKLTQFQQINGNNGWDHCSWQRCKVTALTPGQAVPGSASSRKFLKESCSYTSSRKKAKFRTIKWEILIKLWIKAKELEWALKFMWGKIRQWYLQCGLRLIPCLKSFPFT